MTNATANKILKILTDFVIDICLLISWLEVQIKLFFGKSVTHAPALNEQCFGSGVTDKEV